MSKKDEKFNELINFQQLEIKNWVVEMDKLLTNSGCKVAVDSKGNFTYTSKQSKKIVVRITMKETECIVRPNTINATSSDSIETNLPESMLEVMRNSRGCGGCAKKNPSFIECKHGGPYKFMQEGKEFEACRFVGFNFSVADAENRAALKKWLELELES